VTTIGQSGAMPSWRPSNPSQPDDDLEGAYRDLGEVDPALSARLLELFGRKWLLEAGLPIERLAEVGDTVELLVRQTDDGQVLRLRSWYTGCTYWLDPWDGRESEAMVWIDAVAEMQAGNKDRRDGPTPWDVE
jgi:hypothetical protein